MCSISGTFSTVCVGRAAAASFPMTQTTVNPPPFANSTREECVPTENAAGKSPDRRLWPDTQRAGDGKLTVTEQGVCGLCAGMTTLNCHPEEVELRIMQALQELEAGLRSEVE